MLFQIRWAHVGFKMQEVLQMWRTRLTFLQLACYKDYPVYLMPGLEVLLSSMLRVVQGA